MYSQHLSDNSLLKHRKTAFMGDDTWMTVFPTLFAPNMTFPYDSFNVEDLHTVDEGVLRHLFPLLKDKSGSWDAIIGHFLGVDHVAHRVGPDHPTMKGKLQQMDNVLREVVELLDDDTLLVVLGDHGMDRKGDHGGDDIFETSAALWMYSKGVPLQDQRLVPLVPSELLLKTTYPEAPTAHRWIQQIDIVPTLSLLLGLPIPFNNLGSIVPEAFMRSGSDGASVLDSALKLNAQQIRQYLTAYHSGSHGNEMGDLWASLESVWQNDISSGGLHDVGPRYFSYTRASLEACRSLWARFNVAQIIIGLFVLGLSVISGIVLYLRLSMVTDWENWASKRVDKISQSLLLGAASSPIVFTIVGKYLQNMGFLDIVLMNTSIASCITLLIDGLPSIHLPRLSQIPVLLIIHALCFLSNSFTFWEDRILTFFLVSGLLPSVSTALTSPDGRLRRRILFFSAAYAACVRLMALSKVCREEQQPYCLVTFYASAQVSSSPFAIVLLSLPVSLVIPSVIRRFLSISASDKGLVPKFLNYILRPALMASSVCWILEWAETANMIGLQDASVLRAARTLIARLTFYGVLLGGVTYWWLNPLCIEVRVSEPKTTEEKPKAVVVVNSNAYGSSYLLFWSLIFSLAFLTAQLPGQMALALTLIALLAHFEITDSARDVQGINEAFEKAKLSAALDLDKAKTAPFTFGHLIPLVQLGLHAFFATGHQATLSSLQWKTAFLLTPVVSFYSSRITFALNTFGPIIVTATAAPLLACWQLPAIAGPTSRSAALGASVRACIGVMQCFAVLLLSSAASAAWLRRHLMVWKVFAPRFMAAAVGLVFVDLAMVMVVGLGVHRASWRLAQLLENMQQDKKKK